MKPPGEHEAPLIEIEDIVCRFGSTPAIDGVSLSIEPGEFVALLGPSGSGKTTLLRSLAGLETPESGSIRIGGEDALGIPPNRRGIGFVFQNYALFRHMSVARNIAFGLDIRPRRTRPPRPEIARRVEELLGLIQLPDIGRRFPQQLSGGQQQRVALARALATEPRILLLDEPFGALDTKVRVELRLWLKDLHHRLGLTAIFVTHDQHEALELADRVVVMRAGRIEQHGSPAEIYANPASPFVYSFLGEANQLPCAVSAGRAVVGHVVIAEAAHAADGTATAWFRPEAIELLDRGGLDGTVRDVTAIGPYGRIFFDHGGTIIVATIAAAAMPTLSAGDRIRWRPRSATIYPAA
jgi:sulfate transport system ATP-binding protein